MLRTIICILVLFHPIKASVVDLITYVESDVYTVIEHREDYTGMYVNIYDWYEDSCEWYYCRYGEDWCFPKFFPTLAVRYGQRLDLEK